MAGGRTVYTFEGDPDDLLQAIATVQKALDALAIQSRKTDKAVDAVSESGKKVKKGLDPVASSAKKVGAAFKGLETAAQGMGGKTGEMAGKVAAFGSAAGALANPVGVAVASLAGLVLVVGAVGAGMIAAVFAADELNKELQKFEGHEGFSPIDADALKSIETVNDSLGALVAIFQRLVVEVGANVAPAIEEVSIALVKLGLMGLDAFSKFADGKSLLFEFANFLVKEFLQALIAPLDGLMNLIRVMGHLATAVGLDFGSSLTAASDSYEGFVDGISRSITGGIFDGLGKGLDAVGGATSDYDARARALIKTVGVTDVAIKKHAAAIKSLLSVLRQLVASVEQTEIGLEKIRKLNLAALSPLAKVRSEFFETRREIDKLEESTRKQIASLDEQIEKAEALGLSQKELNKLTRARFSALDNLVTIEDQRLATLEKYNREAVDAAENEADLSRALERAVEGREKYADALAEQLDGLTSLAAKEKEKNGESERYIELINEIIEKQEILKEATEVQTDIEGAANEKRLGWLEELRKKRESVREEEVDGEAELLKKRLEGLDKLATVNDAIGDMFGELMSFMLSQNEELTKGQKQSLTTLYRLQQGSAVASILIDTATAIVKALAMLGPIAGGVAGAAIATTGAVQTAAVLSAPPPFHSGGMIYDTGGVIPGSGSVMINALPGESVLSREATARLGEKGVNGLNSGMQGSSPVTVQMIYKHKIFDVFVSDNILKGGPLSSAIAGNTRVGRSGR